MVTLTAYHLHYCLCDGEHCRVKYKVAAWVSLAKIAPSNGLQRDKKNSATTTSSAPAAALIVMKAAYEGVNPYRPAVKHPKVLLSIPINPIRPFHPIHLICPTRPIGPICPMRPIRSSDSSLHSPHISLLSRPSRPSHPFHPSQSSKLPPPHHHHKKDDGVGDKVLSWKTTCIMIPLYLFCFTESMSK